VLLWADPAGGGFDFDAGEDGYALTDVLRADRDGAPADEISGTLGKTEGDQSAGAGIWQGAHLVPKQSGFGVDADRQADLLLEGGLKVGHYFNPRA